MAKTTKKKNKRKDLKFLRVLLLCENDQIKKNLATKLRMETFTVEIANGGFHAIELCEHGDFDVVLIFCNMHDMPIIETVSLIKTMETMNDKIILFNSDEVDKEDIKDLLNMNKTYPVTKIDNFNNVLSALEKVLL